MIDINGLQRKLLIGGDEGAIYPDRCKIPKLSSKDMKNHIKYIDF